MPVAVTESTGEIHRCSSYKNVLIVVLPQIEGLIFGAGILLRTGISSQGMIRNTEHASLMDSSLFYLNLQIHLFQ